MVYWAVIKELITPIDFQFYALTISRLVMALILGGIVGYDRESNRKSAGLRTHVLVCVGSALIMVISEYFRVYRGFANADPARLGAQVISGIGFLGAGTIIKEGTDVKGLTTAAGIWAVACIGLCVGVGFFGGGILVTLIITTGLHWMKKYEDVTIKSKRRDGTLYIRTTNMQSVMSQVEDILSEHDVYIKSISFKEKNSKTNGVIRVDYKMPYMLRKSQVKEFLTIIEGVKEVY